MLYQGTPYLTTEPPSSIYLRADPPDPAQVSNNTLVGGQCLHHAGVFTPIDPFHSLPGVAVRVFLDADFARGMSDIEDERPRPEYSVSVRSSGHPPLLSCQLSMLFPDSMLSILAGVLWSPLASEIHGETSRLQILVPENNFPSWILTVEKFASAPPSLSHCSAFSTGNPGSP